MAATHECNSVSLASPVLESHSNSSSNPESSSQQQQVRFEQVGTASPVPFERSAAVSASTITAAQQASRRFLLLNDPRCNVMQRALLGRPIRSLQLESDSHAFVLTRMYGSVWPRVIPFCIANCCITAVVYALKHRDHSIDLTSNPSGHTYMGMLMSFLIVTRASIAYNNYMSNSQALVDCYKCIRQLAHTVCLMSIYDSSDHARQWRQDVLYAAILMLRVTVAVLEFRSDPDKEPWEVPELNMSVHEDVVRHSFLSGVPRKCLSSSLSLPPNTPKHHSSFSKSDKNDMPSLSSSTSSLLQRPFPNHSLEGSFLEGDNCNNNCNGDDHRDSESDETTRAALLAASAAAHRLGHTQQQDRILLEEACRVPVFLGFLLRGEIMKQRDGTWLKQGTWTHPCNEELVMLDLVDQFQKSFSSLKKLLTTRFPFPLVQMTRTFLLVWVFTIGFVLCHSDSSSVWMILVMVFLITYGFVGIELVAMELDDCFGNDPSDFDALGHAQHCFEDCYMAVYKMDGERWARALRDKVTGRLVTDEGAIEQVRISYQKDFTKHQ